MDKACREPSADGQPRPSSRGLTQTLVAPSCGAALFIPVSHLWASPARALQSNLPPHLPPRRAPQETHTSCPWPHLAPQQGDGVGGGNARRRSAVSRALGRPGAAECAHVHMKDRDATCRGKKDLQKSFWFQWRRKEEIEELQTKSLPVSMQRFTWVSFTMRILSSIDNRYSLIFFKFLSIPFFRIMLCY